jgi:exodeoxyribonuclease-5
MSEFNFSPQQQEAVEKFRDWYENGETQVFRIFGFAGTGKTTITLHLLEGIKNYAAGSFTGKAALVMRKNGLKRATTIHSMIYKLVQVDDKYLRDLIAKRTEAIDNDDKALVTELQEELEAARKPHFELRDIEETVLDNCDLIVIDEVSMVNEEMGRDLESYGIPILVLGDPGQLPPIAGAGYFTHTATPDVMLTEIHRQAADNPIIDVATKAREGRPVPTGVWSHHTGNATHMKEWELAQARQDFLTQADIVLCGKNATRLKLNKEIRAAVGLDTDPYPVPGDRLMCLQNRKELGIFNGMEARVKSRGDMYADTIEYTIICDDGSDDGKELTVFIHKVYFDVYNDPKALKMLQDNRPWVLQDKDIQHFDFGYAITVHKSQGSQWENVLFYDDKLFRWKGAFDMYKRLVYTAVTRASKNLVMVS